RPAGIITERLNRPRNIHIAGLEERLAIIERLQLGELVLMFLDEVGDTQKDFRSLSWLLVRPWPFIKGFARSFYRTIDIYGIPLGDHCQGLSRRRVHGDKRFARGGIDPFAADEHLLTGRGDKPPHGFR